MALAAVALLIPAVVGAVLAAPACWRGGGGNHRDRLSGDTKPSRRGDGEARIRRRPSFGALGRPDVPAFRGAGEVR
jgi:hypothetical protein